MYRRHPPGRTPLPPLPLSDTAVMCRAIISTTPLRGGRLCRIHSEMHTHSYPAAPEAMTAAPLGAQRLHLPSHIRELGAKAHFRYVRGPSNRHCEVWVSRDGPSRRPDRGTSTGAAGKLAHG